MVSSGPLGTEAYPAVRCGRGAHYSPFRPAIIGRLRFRRSDGCSAVRHRILDVSRHTVDTECGRRFSYRLQRCFRIQVCSPLDVILHMLLNHALKLGPDTVVIPPGGT